MQTSTDVKFNKICYNIESRNHIHFVMLVKMSAVKTDKYENDSILILFDWILSETKDFAQLIWDYITSAAIRHK